MNQIEKIPAEDIVETTLSTKPQVASDVKIKRQSSISIRSGFLVIYDPQNYQALICAAILKRELGADLVEFDRLIDLGYENYVWLGCSKQILPMQSQLVLNKRRVRHVTIRSDQDDEISFKKKKPRKTLASLRDSLLLKISGSAAERFSRMRKIVERLRGAVEEDRLNAFVQFTQTPGLDSDVTMIDRMLVDMELTGRPMASTYRYVSSRIAAFDKLPPFWKINCNDHISRKYGFESYRDKENFENISKMKDYNEDIGYTHLIITAAKQAIGSTDVEFTIPTSYNSDIVMKYYVDHMADVKRRLHNSWRWENLVLESGKTIRAVRMATSKQDMPYAKRILMLSGNHHLNVINGINGMIVTSNIKINPKSEINNEVTFN